MKTYTLKTDDFTIAITVDNGGGVVTSDLKKLLCKKERDVIESLVLAHACAGVEVDSPAYIAGITTTIEALQNQYC